MMPAETKELRALLVSDTHVNGMQMNLLAEWLKHVEGKYDFVFLTGNLSNMINKQRKDYMAEGEAAQQVVDTLTYFLEHVKVPIIYVPGNTEPSATYTYGLEIPHAINAHKRAVQLDSNLVVIGLGGSIPVQKDGKDILEGFPYQKDEDFGKELTSCFETAQKNFGPGMEYLVLTHVGPVESATSEAYLGKDKVNVGSKALGELLKKHGESIVCNVHGHSSLGEGMTKPYASSVPIINPGGLTSGRFGELTLVKVPTGKWKVAGVNFHNFDAAF